MTISRFLLALGLTAVVCASPAVATQVVHQSLRDLTLGSSDIVIGQVAETRAHWNPSHTKIITDVTFHVSQSLKGGPGDVLTLTQLGGDADGFRYAVPGSPLFRPGEQALLFVWRDPQGRAQVNGLAQGKFDIRTDAATGTRTVQRSVAGTAVRDVRTLSLVGPGESAPRLPLADMVSEIQAILAEGGR
ncbi:MAG TPA: hypothetical protein VMS88_06200 [Terriglobales bacterium]|nr:hypothetical protein [Terriglobales bacterium]